MYNRIYIEVTNICNLSCSFCPIEEQKKEVMPVERFEKILRQAAPLAKQICLHIMGEPLAHPRIDEILRLCEKYETQVMITTNGVLISRYTDLLLNSPIIRQVNFSLQAYMDNYPERSFEDYLDKINDFIQSANERKPELYMNLRLWNMEDEKLEGSNEEVFKYFEEKLDIEINRVVDVGGIKSKRIWNRLYLHFDSRFEWPRPELEKQGEVGRCNGLKDHFAIHSDGVVSPCCLDDMKNINLGNCLEDSLESVLNSKRAKEMAKGFSENRLVEELCQKCSYINRFKRS